MAYFWIVRPLLCITLKFKDMHNTMIARCHTFANFEKGHQLGPTPVELAVCVCIKHVSHGEPNHYRGRAALLLLLPPFCAGALNSRAKMAWYCMRCPAGEPSSDIKVLVTKQRCGEVAVVPQAYTCVCEAEHHPDPSLTPGYSTAQSGPGAPDTLGFAAPPPLFRNQHVTSKRSGKRQNTTPRCAAMARSAARSASCARLWARAPTAIDGRPLARSVRNRSSSPPPN